MHLKIVSRCKVFFFYFIQSVSIADPSQSRLKAEMVVEMLHEDQVEEDEAILSPDSESKIYDANVV